MFVDNIEESRTGPKSIGIPGEVFGLYRVWQKYGKVKYWKDLVEPSIQLCKNGFKITQHVVNAIKHKANVGDDFYDITHKGERPVETGDIIKNERLGHTLQRIADDPLSFYRGALANEIALDIKDAGGRITANDLREYNFDEDLLSTLTLQNGGYKVHSVRPPAGGTAFQYILNILDSFNISASDKNNSILLYHHIVEAFKFSFAKRSSLGDNNFANIDDIIDDMLNSTYGRRIRDFITDDTTHSQSYYNSSHSFVADNGTSHTSIFAPDGSAVSVTSTINSYFGSSVRGKRTGIIFNNQMGDFSTPGNFNAVNSLPSNQNNFPEPFKRPMSSTCPTIILDAHDEVRLIIGGSGGTKIPTAVAQAVINHLWLDMPISEAITKPRLHHQLVPPYILHEERFCSHIIKNLRQKGHETKIKIPTMAAVNAVSFSGTKDSATRPDEKSIEGASDGRRYSYADGC